MSVATYVLGIVAALLAIFAIVELMRRRTLRERHAAWWLVGGILALVVAVFPQTLTWASKLLGIVVPTNLAFFVAIALLFLVSLQYGAELTRAEDKLRDLAEQAAFHDDRLRALERTLEAARDAADRGDAATDADGGAPEDAGTDRGEADGPR